MVGASRMTMASTMQTKTNGRSLPKGWQWVKLGDLLTTLETGSRPKGGAQGITSGIPSLSAEHMTRYGTFDFSELRFVPREFYEQMPRGHIKLNDILIVKDGATTGKSAFVDDSFLYSEAVINEHVFLCRPDLEKINPLYLFYYLWSPLGLNQIRQNFQGAAIGGINQSFTGNVVIPLPPLDEQRRVAIRLNEQLTAVESARRAAVEQLQAARQLPSAYLREVFGDSTRQKWHWHKLGEVCEITASQVDPKIPEYGVLPHVNGENIESGTCRLLYLNTAAEEGLKSGKYLFDAGDVLYSKLRPYLRKVVIADFRGVCSADMYPIKVNQDVLDAHFLSWVLVSDEFTEYADEESRRARMPKLNREQLFAYEAPIPTLDEQKQIAAFMKDKIEQSKQIISTLESQLAEISRLSASLLREAFAGKL
jgi:restriction endonuclease S subunit